MIPIYCTTVLYDSKYCTNWLKKFVWCCSIGSVTSDSELSDNGEVRTAFKINTFYTVFVVSSSWFFDLQGIDYEGGANKHSFYV